MLLPVAGAEGRGAVPITAGEGETMAGYVGQGQDPEATPTRTVRAGELYTANIDGVDVAVRVQGNPEPGDRFVSVRVVGLDTSAPLWGKTGILPVNALRGNGDGTETETPPAGGVVSLELPHIGGTGAAARAQARLARALAGVTFTTPRGGK